MKFTTVALLATSASAAIVERNAADAAKVAQVVNKADSDVKAVTSAAKSYTGGTPTEALNAAKQLVSDVTAGQSTVSPIADHSLQLADAVAIVTPVQNLGSDAKTLVSTLISKRSAVESAGQCSAVRTQVNSVASSSDTLISLILRKVANDAAVQQIATSLAGLVKVQLSSAKDAFSPQSCIDKSGGGGGSSSSTKSTTLASATTKPAPTSTGGSNYSAPTASASASGSSSAAYTPPAATTTPAVGPTSTSTPPTAAAGVLAPAGALALAVAAFAL